MHLDTNDQKGPSERFLQPHADGESDAHSVLQTGKRHITDPGLRFRVKIPATSALMEPRTRSSSVAGPTCPAKLLPACFRPHRCAGGRSRVPSVPCQPLCVWQRAHSCPGVHASDGIGFCPLGTFQECAT